MFGTEYLYKLPMALSDGNCIKQLIPSPLWEFEKSNKRIKTCINKRCCFNTLRFRPPEVICLFFLFEVSPLHCLGQSINVLLDFVTPKDCESGLVKEG